MAAFVDLKERMNMTFLTLDYCGKEEIYGGKNLATGAVACDVLNIPEKTVQQIVLLTDPMMRFVDALYDNRVDLLLMEQSRKNVFRVVSLLKTVAPFSYQDFTWLDQKLSDIFSAEAMRKASRQMHKAGGLGELFVRALSLVAQLGFGIQEYQRALIPLVESLDNEDLTRNAEGYVLPVDITWKYAYHCFQLDPAPMEKEENWYIHAACEHNDLKYILFFLHHYEKKLNNLIRRALIGTEKYLPEIFLDVKCSCLETVFKKYLDFDPKQNTKFSTYLFPFIRDTILFFKMREEAWTIQSLTFYKNMRSMASIYHKHNGNCAKAIDEFSQKARCSTKIAQLYLDKVLMLRMRQDYSISYENDEGEFSNEEVVEDAGWLEFGTLWNYYSNDNVQNAFWKLRYRDQLLIEKRNALCMSCGRIGKKKERYSYEQLSALIQASTDKGAEKAYKKALENLLVRLIEDRAMRVVRIKRKNQKRRKQKIAAATYLYQADCDGEWGEIKFDFEKGTAEIKSLADWDTTISHIFAKEVIAYLLRCKNEDLPEETLRVLEW